MLPEWMRASPQMSSRAKMEGRGPGRARRNFVRRALGAFARLAEEMLGHRQTAELPGLLQRVDARAKLVGMCGLIVVVSLLHNIFSLMLAYGLSLVLAAVSQLPARRVMRVWLAVPLFSAALILPATLNVITPGRPLAVLWHSAGRRLGPWLLPEAITITDAGIVVAVRFILRVGVCVTLAFVLAATTRPDRLFRGLRGLGVPRIFVVLLGMMQRYLEVLLRAAEEIHLAKISRTVALGSVRAEQRWVAAGVGSLLRRTHALGQEVFLAMISRGYSGEARLLEAPRWRAQEWLFLGGICCFALMLVMLG